MNDWDMLDWVHVFGFIIPGAILVWLVLIKVAIEAHVRINHEMIHVNECLERR